ncbi:MAG: xanthomonadin transporter, partial [Rhodanobacteraceae bacterium]
MRSARPVLLVLWLAALSVLGFFVLGSLRIGTDLRSFMPPPQTADQKLLMDQIGEGPGARLLLIAIRGAPESRLAELSRGLTEALNADPHFERALNGAFDPASLDEKWLPYRYLLSPTLDSHRLDAAFLRDQLQQRIEDLASPAAALLKP